MPRHMSACFLSSAKRITCLCAGTLLLSSAAAAQTPSRPALVPLPLMGWASWNSFWNTIDAAIVVRQALGDRAWRKATDMSNVALYLHDLGLKAAICTDAGEFGCSYAGPDLGPRRPHTGSLGHYGQGFLQFAKWGFDYVKVDWCGGNKANLDPAIQYAEIARAIARAEAATGHRLYFSICNWGRQSPWTWALGIGGVAADMWRTGGDISDPIVAGSIHANRRVGPKNVLTNFDHGIHPEAQHTGSYKDLDMMALGMPGMNEMQDRVHMSLWALAGTPLMVGADLTKLSKAELAILTDRAIVGIDQDALGLQCVKIAEPSPGLQVWVKPSFKSGERAMLLLNRTDTPAQVAVDWATLGLGSAPVSVQDLSGGKDMGKHASSYSAAVAANDAVLLPVGARSGRELANNRLPQKTKAR